MAFNQYAKTERDFTTLLNSANMSPTDRDRLSAVLASLVGFQATQPGTNQTLEEQIANIDTEIVGIEEQIGEILTAINNIKVPVWKMQVFDADGTFTVPESIAGSVVYVTASGGGGSGAARVFAGSGVATVSGANSGCYINRMPLSVSAGDAIPITIGAGGEPVTVTSSATSALAGNAGSSTTVGPLTIQGGAGGSLAQNIFDDTRGGWIGGYLFGTAQILPAQNSIAYRAGRRVTSGAVTANGSAAGAFGNGVDGVTTLDANATAAAAGANTGAGGGGAVVERTAGTLTATSGAGGRGKVIIEWQEFV